MKTCVGWGAGLNHRWNLCMPPTASAYLAHAVLNVEVDVALLGEQMAPHLAHAALMPPPAVAVVPAGQQETDHIT